MIQCPTLKEVVKEALERHFLVFTEFDELVITAKQILLEHEI